MKSRNTAERRLLTTLALLFALTPAEGTKETRHSSVLARLLFAIPGLRTARPLHVPWAIRQITLAVAQACFAHPTTFPGGTGCPASTAKG